jgi:hypothetical protein
MAMEMAVESMEMAPGAMPRPDRVPKERLLSLELHLQRRWCCGTLSGKASIDLGFLRRRLYIGRGAMLEGTRGAHTRWWHDQGWTRATRWCGHLLALLHLYFELCLVPGKIGISGFISSNSENISCVTFLKHKQQKTGTGTMASC